MMSECVAIILCAGESSRMGSPKALLPWGDHTVVEQIIGQVQASGIDQVLVVTGAHDPEIRAALPAISTLFHTNPTWESGMGSSIASGVTEALKRFKTIQGFLLLLGDQPLIETDYLKSMITIYHQDPGQIVASQYPEGAGVPALFPRGLAQKLKSLSGEHGARDLLRSEDAQLQVFPATIAGRDMDTPEAYEALYDAWATRKNGPA